MYCITEQTSKYSDIVGNQQQREKNIHLTRGKQRRALQWRTGPRGIIQLQKTIYFLALPSKRGRSKSTPVCKSIPSPFPLKGTRTLGNWQKSGLGQVNYQISFITLHQKVMKCPKNDRGTKSCKIFSVTSTIKLKMLSCKSTKIFVRTHTAFRYSI